MVTCVAAVGGRVPGFWSRYAVEHVCDIGFVKRGLDLRRSNRERHGLLGLEILDTALSHGGCEMSCCLDPAKKHA